MNVITKKKIINFSCDTLALLFFFIAASCIILKLQSSMINFQSLSLLPAKFILFRGSFNAPVTMSSNEFNPPPYIDSKTEQNNSSTAPTISSGNFSLPDISESDEEEKHSPDEKKCKIIETHISSGGEKCENFFVKNSTGHNFNLLEYLAKSPEVHIKNNDEPQVLIMHTHTSEAYMSKDTGFFYESFYPRSLNDSKNVTQVGKAVVESLKKNGINAIHCTTYHDNPTYNGSYSRAAETIKENLRKYPSIQVVIDIHRDSMGSKESGKVKPTFTYKDKKASQMMIICGCDPDKTLGFPNWEKNLVLALKLQKYCETLFPGITRPLNFSKVKYNEHLTPGSLLIEVGSDVNTLQESVYTGSMLGESLSKLLTDLKK